MLGPSRPKAGLLGKEQTPVRVMLPVGVERGRRREGREEAEMRVRKKKKKKKKKEMEKV